MATPPKILIYLLRRDLRLTDNPVFYDISQILHSGNAPFTHLLPLYVFAAHQVEVSGFLKPADDTRIPQSPFPEARSQIGNFWRCGPHRAKFLGESVWDLKESLRKVESELCIRFGYLPDVVRDALRFYKENPSQGQVCGIWMTKEDTSEEKKDERRIQKVADEENIELKLFKDEKYFIHDDDLPFENITELPDVFTTFRKSLEPLRDRPRRPLPFPEKLPPFPEDASVPPILDDFTVPDTRHKFVECMLKPIRDTIIPSTPPIRPADDIETYSAHPFAGGETQALQRLNHILENGIIVKYKDTRNGLVGTAFSTKLSAYLAIGCLSARLMHARMVLFENGESAIENDQDRELLKTFEGPGCAQGENVGTQSVRYELLWRDYMRLCSRKFGSKLFQQAGFRGVYDKQWRGLNDKSSNSRAYVQDTLHRFLAGHTGIGIIDASQRELFWTGYTSNRARQNVASFLAKHLNIDWRLGAEWYECMLVDYDASSNWGNWQYVSGVGNDPREGRIFNPVKQALDYDSKGDYIMTWIPELRRIDIKNQAGDVDAEKLMGLFQAWRIPEEERLRLGLAGLNWVDQPLERIAFSVGRKPRNNARGRGGNRGRGGGGGRGGRGGRGVGGGGRGRGGRWRYHYHGGQKFQGVTNTLSPAFG